MTLSRNPDRSTACSWSPRSKRQRNPSAGRRARWAACALVPLLAATARPAPGQLLDRDALLQQQRKQRDNLYKMQQQTVASYPRLPGKTLDDVLRLKMDGRNLTLVSPLMAGDHDTGSYRVESNVFKGPTYVQIQPFIAMNAFGVPQKPGGLGKRFALISYDFPNPDELDTLSVLSDAGYLQIYRQSQIGAGGFRMIRLVQTKAPGGQAAGRGAGRGAEVSVQLSVNESGEATPQGRAPRNFNLQAGDFQALVREHGREADEFVRPLLRQIGQEAVLAPDEQIAWQVLSDRWQPDPVLARKVRDLLPAFNDADFHARDRALVEMQQMGKAGAAVLLHLDRAALTPEQNLAIDRTLAPFAQLSAKEAARLRDDADFLLDCLYAGDREVRAAALDRLKQVTGKELPFSLDASEADRNAAVSALRRQLAARAPAGPTTEPAKS